MDVREIVGLFELLSAGRGLGYEAGSKFVLDGDRWERVP